ncbi:hypothetical protein CCO03_10230 [Comamonas serinivorans]|uniref:FecR protein domain-containing protein n=1 Tax=Comamonas serinivorans TaxID=1082851 RepID=A0A1Y0ENY6_9BURK|nr:FecR domain-containing protein [Comamonas serinivorans]ARU05012.1 hypothetical protein CCO03_10230 [Comamonas serinivorans]
MNLHLSSWLRSLTVICALGLGAAHAAEPLPSSGGIFKAVEGEVFVVHGNSRTQPVVGQAIAESDRIETGSKSGAALTLSDGTVITVGANSSVSLTALRYEPVNQTGNLAVQIVQGTLRMITGALGKSQPDNVKVTTPTAVIGVRGTDFIVDVES